jgi:hypothetical protein
MGILRWFSKKKRLNPQGAASVVFTEARISLDEDLLPQDFRVNESVSRKIAGIIFLTKIATAIQWIRIVTNNARYPEKWERVQEELERLVFPPDPLEGVDLVSYINQLIQMTIELQAIIRDVSVTDSMTALLGKRTLNWCREWLGPVSDDADLLDGLAFEHGSAIALYVSGEMKKIADLLTRISTRL